MDLSSEQNSVSLVILRSGRETGIEFLDGLRDHPPYPSHAEPVLVEGTETIHLIRLATAALPPPSVCFALRRHRSRYSTKKLCAVSRCDLERPQATQGTAECEATQSSPRAKKDKSPNSRATKPAAERKIPHLLALLRDRGRVPVPTKKSKGEGAGHGPLEAPILSFPESKAGNIEELTNFEMNLNMG